MSRAHRYYQARDPNFLGDDPDSDIELDLQELAPQAYEDHGTSEDATPLQKIEESNGSRDIPLRKIRLGASRGTGRRTRRQHAAYEDTEQDGHRQSRQSQDFGSGVERAEDIVPLLDYGHSSQTRRLEYDGSWWWVWSRKVLARITGNSGAGFDEQPPVTEARETGSPRSIVVGQFPNHRFPPNAVSNAKYTPWGFLPRTLYNEFSYFLNLYFLLVALSQIIPPLRIGYLSTYIAPLAFVISITLGKEALDDIARRRRDAEANKEEYTILDLRVQTNGLGTSKQRRTRSKGRQTHGRLDDIEEEEENVGGSGKLGLMEIAEINVKSKDLKVGDVLKLGKDQRVPADLVILRSYASETMTANPPLSESSRSHTEVDFLVDSQSDPVTLDSSPKIESNNYASSSEDGVGETFIRTDQLDGETDWKLRLASPITQNLRPHDYHRLTLSASKPGRNVNEFIGSLELAPATKGTEQTSSQNGAPLEGRDKKIVTAPLTIDNTAWANTVLASSATVFAVVVYTGSQTRQAMSTSASRSKTGLLELEINNLTKILCILTVTLSLVLVAFENIHGRPTGDPQKDPVWYVSIFRFLILFSTIIPISLRVNLDLGKSVYAWFIERDHDIPDTVVRTSTIPEDLGRIEYLLSDKTGTLTQNEMELKKIHVGTVSYSNEAMEEVASYVKQGYSSIAPSNVTPPAMLITPSSLVNPANTSGTRTRREIGSRVRDVVLALALCHNVTPTTEEGPDGESVTTYQASSPDEIAIVRWTESVGLRVVHRDRHNIALQSVDSDQICVRVRILDIFAFTSETKRMGIILQFLSGPQSASPASCEPGEIWFYQKGADTIMTTIVAANDWLDEETANMAREGLRTLVVGRRKLSAQQYADFAAAYKEASLSLTSRDTSMAAIVSTHLERNLELLGVTGVEDKLQKDVKPSLELLRNAGIKIWMLTGDKVETARCVAVSSKLVARNQTIQTITQLPALVRTTSSTAAQDALALLASSPDSTALLIDGDSLAHLLSHHRQSFIALAVLLPAVIACRCSPTQKADIALLIRSYTKKRIACIGDGGNDVSMIQAADIGLGIVGKEGRQASLAADFSLTQFCHVTKLLVWHGRNSYKRSAKLSQFVIHRGLIISVAQTVYSASTRFRPEALYRDWLLVGYATLYTMFPVFSLVLDRDVDEALANLYPELYRELKGGRVLSLRTFGIWMAVSAYQGILIQVLSQFLIDDATGEGFWKMIAVSFSSLVVNELAMVGLEVVTWHWVMAVTIAGTAVGYVASLPFLGGYFPLGFFLSVGFWWRFAVIVAGSVGPVGVGREVSKRVRPESYRKVRGV